MLLSYSRKRYAVLVSVVMLLVLALVYARQATASDVQPPPWGAAGVIDPLVAPLEGPLVGPDGEPLLDALGQEIIIQLPGTEGPSLNAGPGGPVLDPDSELHDSVPSVDTTVPDPI